MKIDFITEGGSASFIVDGKNRQYIDIEDQGQLYTFELYFDGKNLKVKKIGEKDLK